MNTTSADAPASILWRREDSPGHESARVERAGDGWRLRGTAAFAHEGQPCCLSYDIACDSGWRTLAARVGGWVGATSIDIDIRVDADARTWRMNGEEMPRVAGCVDVDLNFSPSTNLLPIRRLGLQIGEESTVRAAWLRFPSFALEPLQQTYTRIGEDGYRYESGGGAFVRDLRVNAAGLPTRYPDFWETDAEDGA